MTKSDPLHAVRMISQRVRAPSYFCTTLTIKNLVSMIIHALMLQASDLLAKVTTTIPSVHGFYSALLNNISLVDLSHFSQVSYFPFFDWLPPVWTSQLHFSFSTKIMFTKLTSNTPCAEVICLLKFPFCVALWSQRKTRIFETFMCWFMSAQISPQWCLIVTL